MRIDFDFNKSSRESVREAESFFDSARQENIDPLVVTHYSILS
jgi:hypothetical protein